MFPNSPKRFQKMRGKKFQVSEIRKGRKLQLYLALSITKNTVAKFSCTKCNIRKILQTFPRYFKEKKNQLNGENQWKGETRQQRNRETMPLRPTKVGPMVNNRGRVSCWDLIRLNIRRY